MRNQKPVLIILFLCSLIFSSCSSDDSEGSDAILFSAKINGELFEATKLEQSTVIQHPVFGQRFDIVAENDTYKIIFVLTNREFNDCMLTGDYDNFDNETEVLFDVYHRVEGTNNFVSPYFPSEDNNGVVLQKSFVSSCDNKTVSGTFSGGMYNILDPNDTSYPANLEITEGKFQNIEFLLLNQ